MRAFLTGIKKGDLVNIAIGEQYGVSYWPQVKVVLCGRDKIIVDWNGNGIHFDKATGLREGRPEQRLVSEKEAAHHNRGVFA